MFIFMMFILNLISVCAVIHLLSVFLSFAPEKQGELQLCVVTKQLKQT